MDREPTPEERIARRRAQREAQQRKSEDLQRKRAASTALPREILEPASPPALPVASEQSDKKLAEAWARSTGLVDIPPKPHTFNGWICFILAWFWLIPAIIYFFWCESRATAYSEAINQALRAWRANGSPDPYALRATPSARPSQPSEPDISEKIEQLSALREKGLLTEEEFAAAKKKILGI